MREDAILVASENLKSALGEHSDEGYAGFEDVHGLLGPNFDDSLIALALTMHGHVDV